MGLGFGWATGWLLRWVRFRGVQAHVQALLLIALAYLAFYVAQAPAGGSGAVGHLGRLLLLLGAPRAWWGLRLRLGRKRRVPRLPLAAIAGVIAVCVFGLCGSATSQWGMLAADEESGTQFAVWDAVGFAANGGWAAAVSAPARTSSAPHGWCVGKRACAAYSSRCPCPLAPPGLVFFWAGVSSVNFVAR